MEVITETEIRDFRIRGNYVNQRSLLSKLDLHSCKVENTLPNSPGSSPPVVEFELQNGQTSSIVVSEADIPALCDDDFEKAKRHLGRVLSARQGDPEAARELSAEAQAQRLGVKRIQPSESSFVVPSTSCETHSEQDISQKAFVLLKLSQLGYPVPDFVVLTSHAYAERAERFEEHVADALQQLEILTMQGLSDCKSPLVFAIRCATAHYIPGVMDTYLNVGVTESALPSLERMYGRVAASKMFLNNLRNLCQALHHDEYVAIIKTVKSDLRPDEVERLVEQLSQIVRKTDRRLTEDAFFQATFFARQAYKHFEENLELVLTLCRGTEHYPSLILQKMICTVRHENAYAGVISSRHTQTGSGIELQTAHNIFGEDMMTGAAEIESTSFEDREAIKRTFPAVYHFVSHLGDLERDFESPVTIEFAVEATERHQLFALLQLNQTGMAGRAAITSVVDMHKSGIISRQRVTELIRPYHLKQLTSDTINQDDFSLLKSFCSGVAVLPRSAVSARIYFTGERALSAKSQGEMVCLCKKTFLPTDTVVMREMDAIISLTSAAVHVVTICQSLGIPALLSLEKNGVTLQPDGRLVNSSGREINEGDWITVSSRRRTLYEGKAKFKPGRLLRYMKGEPVEMDEEERRAFASIAYAYRYYQQLTRGLEVDQISTLSEVIRLVDFELRGESEEAKQLVNGWFDEREALYTEEVLKSDIGDHLGQSRVFEMLTLERKIRFFKLALAKCSRERISGYEAGAFMLGRFLCLRYPAAFWKCFAPSEIALLVNEWVLFEKYMQILHTVGERKILLARKEILKGGLEQLSLHPGNVQPLITLKLSGVKLQEAKESLPAWSDPQSQRVLELLQQPYRVFYDFNAAWSVNQLEKICREETLPLPQPDDT
jgi:pyruvate,orthophosphate dikinase